ncbi:hypothetical protein Zm00014a_011425 [Zea mays]|uniref:Uncharacterized protein n=1 Tax=Zea mays TaxID=4577 RepID=A0A317Y8Y5_MAIZE|nr:hypothetical protein Zm00014a_011425 [Zea mays]
MLGRSFCIAFHHYKRNLSYNISCSY